MFHQVNNSKTDFYPAMPVNAFKDLCEFIKANYSVIKLSEIQSHFLKSNKPAAVISFDDAHYDILENAYPILSKLGLPFNVNVDTEILETGKPQDFVRVYNILNHTQIETYIHSKYMTKPIVINRLNPIITENEFTLLLSGLTTIQKREVTEDLAYKAGMDDKAFSNMLSKEDIKYLSEQNVEFGSHSHTHSILTKIPPEQVEHELSYSKQILENITKKKIEILAYPNGIYNDKIEKSAQKNGYSILLQTDDKINYVQPDNRKIHSYKRINQYHHNLEEALAHTYGVLNNIKKFRN